MSKAFDATALFDIQAKWGFTMPIGAADEIVALMRALATPPERAETPQTSPAPSDEGCTPADVRILRAANGALAQESHEVQDALADLYEQVSKFCAEQGEADFETGRALYLLSKLRPEEYHWPFTEPPAQAKGAPQAPTEEPLLDFEAWYADRLSPADRSECLNAFRAGVHYCRSLRDHNP